MSIHPYLEEMERSQAYPLVAFNWADMNDPSKWSEDIRDLQGHLDENAKKSEVIILAGGGRYLNKFGGYYEAAAACLRHVIQNSRPCGGRELVSRVLTVLENSMPPGPESDRFQGEVMGRFNEALYLIVKRNRDLHAAGRRE